MKPYPVAPFLLALMACATPQQRCIAKAAPDLPVLNRLIAESEGNLARGYAFADVEVEMDVWKLCGVDLTPSAGGQTMCLETETTTTREAVAIDLTAEAAKLASMRARRDEIEAQAQPAFAQCQAQFPK